MRTVLRGGYVPSPRVAKSKAARAAAQALKARQACCAPADIHWPDEKSVWERRPELNRDFPRCTLILSRIEANGAPRAVWAWTSCPLDDVAIDRLLHQLQFGLFALRFR
jgi:hypothetical protein